MNPATASLAKPFECCIISAPKLFTNKSPSKNLSPPLKLNRLSCFSLSFSPSISSWVSRKTQKSPSILVPLVAQTSDVEYPEAGAASSELVEGSFDGEVLEEEEEEAIEEGYPEPPEEAKVFVGNLHFDIDSEQLAKLFDQAGVVEVAEVIYNRETDRSRGFGFVTMSNVEEAEKAVDMFNRYDLNGRLLTVNRASPRGTRPEPSTRVFEQSFKIYVGNLPWQVDDSRLEQVFSEHGKVVDARVVYDRDTGRSRGFGFVTMSSETELNDAIAALDGQSLDGRAIRVNVAEERARRMF